MSSDKRKECMGGTFQSAGGVMRSLAVLPDTSDKFSIIVDMSSSTNMSGNDNFWYQVTSMVYLSEEVAATYVM